MMLRNTVRASLAHTGRSYGASSLAYRCIATSRRVASGAPNSNSNGSSGSKDSVPDINFNDTSAYSERSVLDLARTAVIQSVCKIKPLVQHADKLIGGTRKVVGDNITDFALRHTFFGHFCGGEKLREVDDTIKMLESQGVFP
jgi:hypothetical protein